MRHQVAGKKLSRDTNARKALLANLASSLFENGQVVTTVAKAKFAKGYVEKMITISKKGSLSKDRKLASVLTKNAFTNLKKEITGHLNGRSSGYTRIIKMGVRRGDAAPLAKLEIIDWGNLSPKKNEDKKTSATTQKTKKVTPKKKENDKKR